MVILIQWYATNQTGVLRIPVCFHLKCCVKKAKLCIILTGSEKKPAKAVSSQLKSGWLKPKDTVNIE